MPVRPAIIASLCYKNAPAAIEFLEQAFGFATHARFDDASDPGVVQHAELVRDGQMIMLSTLRTDTDYARKARVVHPQDVGGNTVSIYVVLDDVDAHAAQARAAGATIIMDPVDQDYGGRMYVALDGEGYAWSFGSYDPFAG